MIFSKVNITRILTFFFLEINIIKNVGLNISHELFQESFI